MAAPSDPGPEGTVAWLDADQMREWRSLMALVTRLPSALDAQLKRDAGLNGFEYHVLAALSDAPDHTLPLTDLAGRSRGSLSRLSHAVTRLENAGWLTRERCTGGGPSRVEARLTAAGVEKLQDCAPGHVREVRRLVVDVLTPDELRALGHAARTVVRAAGLDPADGDRVGPPPPC